MKSSRRTRRRSWAAPLSAARRARALHTEPDPGAAPTPSMLATTAVATARLRHQRPQEVHHRAEGAASRSSAKPRGRPRDDVPVDMDPPASTTASFDGHAEPLLPRRPRRRALIDDRASATDILGAPARASSCPGASLPRPTHHCMRWLAPSTRARHRDRLRAPRTRSASRSAPRGGRFMHRGNEWTCTRRGWRLAHRLGARPGRARNHNRAWRKSSRRKPRAARPPTVVQILEARVTARPSSRGSSPTAPRSASTTPVGSASLELASAVIKGLAGPQAAK